MGPNVWWERVARRLDLPAEALGETVVTLEGRRRLTVDNHQGIAAFSRERIVVRTTAGARLVVRGAGLVIEAIWPGRLSIVGTIEGMDWQP